MLTEHIILCAYIENKLPPHLVRLIEHHNIAHFARYPADALKRMAEGFKNTPQLRTAIILRAKTDYSSAGDSMHKDFEQLSEGYNVHLFEVGTKSDVARALKLMGEELAIQGKKIDLVMFDGHGSENVFQMGYPYSNFTTHLTVQNTRYLAPYKAFLAEDAQCIFAACSTARGGKDADGLAYALAGGWQGVEVFAANNDTSLKNIFLDDNKRLKTVEFNQRDHLEVIQI
jgi:hypothetical protein